MASRPPVTKKFLGYFDELRLVLTCVGAVYGIGQDPQEGIWKVFFRIGNALHGSGGILVTMYE